MGRAGRDGAVAFFCLLRAAVRSGVKSIFASEYRMSGHDKLGPVADVTFSNSSVSILALVLEFLKL